MINHTNHFDQRIPSIAHQTEFVPRPQRRRLKSRLARNRVKKKMKARERYVDDLDGNPRATGEGR